MEKIYILYITEIDIDLGGTFIEGVYASKVLADEMGQTTVTNLKAENGSIYGYYVEEHTVITSLMNETN